MRMLVATLILFSATQAWTKPSENACHRFFNYPDGTQKLISYVESIALPLQFTILDYQNFLHGLQANVITNFISSSRARVDSAAKVHRHGLQHIIDHYAFSIRALELWAVRKISSQQSVQNERRSAELTTKSLSRQMKFIRINGLTRYAKSAVVSPHPIEMMDTHVTQEMWVNVMGGNTWFRLKNDQEDVQQVIINGSVVKYIPDRPILNPGFWNAIIYANEVSKRVGLKPAYNIEGVQFARMNQPSDKELLDAAKNGELTVSSIESTKTFIRNNSARDLLQREGFRFPLPDEYKLIIEELAVAGGTKAKDLSIHQLELFAWFGLSTIRVPFEVASLNPFTIEGQKVYDLLGNVSTMSYLDAFEDDNTGVILLGDDYVGTREEILNIIRKPTSRHSTNSAEGGIRLVRTVLP